MESIHTIYELSNDEYSRGGYSTNKQGSPMKTMNQRFSIVEE